MFHAGIAYTDLDNIAMKQHNQKILFFRLYFILMVCQLEGKKKKTKKQNETKRKRLVDVLNILHS